MRGHPEIPTTAEDCQGVGRCTTAPRNHRERHAGTTAAETLRWRPQLQHRADHRRAIHAIQPRGLAAIPEAPDPRNQSVPEKPGVSREKSDRAAPRNPRRPCGLHRASRGHRSRPGVSVRSAASSDWRSPEPPDRARRRGTAHLQFPVPRRRQGHFRAHSRVERVGVVTGGSYIAYELAEAFRARGWTLTGCCGDLASSAISSRRMAASWSI